MDSRPEPAGFGSGRFLEDKFALAFASASCNSYSSLVLSII